MMTLTLTLLLLPLLMAESALACTLPEPSTENFNISTAHKTWYEQYRYPMLAMDLQGCLTITQDPGKSNDTMKLKGYFSHNSLFPVTASATLKGNQLQTSYDGIFGWMISGPRNIVYINDDFYIDHYCMLGTEVSTIFTADKSPSDEVMKQVWEVVANHTEVDKSRYLRIFC
ncbi:uncharacterized protein LOC126094795 [Schistocerca cancellata]|uniref:uncharacterized protein LOC126094795 n=1 Tax=Schistocerca cancellata TaxID=274614 RepID=UPI002117C39C|nr:uncharacterized protein LOC126094795 [Schistocerca cancellata]